MVPQGYPLNIKQVGRQIFSIGPLKKTENMSVFTEKDRILGCIKTVIEDDLVHIGPLVVCHLFFRRNIC